jgi:predicted metal-dependent phosphoesterase TrpH
MAGGDVVKADLHVHSSASDGALAPTALVERAAAGGLDLIAIADHDTVAGVLPAKRAAPEGLTVLPAIEISAVHRERDLHILGYDVDPGHPGLLAFAESARRGRADRIRHMIDRLEGLGVQVPFEDVVEEAGPDARVLARPHLARALQARGHVASISEAFDRYIGDGGPAFVPTDMVDVPDAIALIREAGGIAVWAHPPLPAIGALPEFVEAGMEGLECHRPRVQPAELRRLLSRARTHDLLVTGGSDWHGDWHGELGQFHLGRDRIRPFLERVGL